MRPAPSGPRARPRAAATAPAAGPRVALRGPAPARAASAGAHQPRQGQQGEQPRSAGGEGRRSSLLALGVVGAAPALAAMGGPAPVRAEEEELETFWGAANPPATYGGTSRTAPDQARYSFLYPAGWTEEFPNKVEKGTNGTDSRLVKKIKKERVYVVSLSRLGEDVGKGYNAAKDLDKTLQGLAISDYNLQDALNTAEDIVVNKRELENGQAFFDVDILSSIRYMATLTSDGGGRFYAMFISAPEKAFESDRPLFETMRKSFRTYIQ